MRVYDLDEIEKKLKNIPDRTIQFLKPDSLKQELSIITNQFETGTIFIFRIVEYKCFFKQ